MEQKEKGYPGTVTCYAQTRNVYYGEELLDPEESKKLRNHSPDGFAWGYPGSGPAQLALALLLKYTGDPAVARSHYQAFKWEKIAIMPTNEDVEFQIEFIGVWLRHAIANNKKTHV